jgi:hypothetical protein
MMNDEFQMTKEFPITNDERAELRTHVHLNLVIHSPLVIRYSSFQN